MTNEQILELASQHLRFFEDGYRGTEWSGTPEQLLKFALQVADIEYDRGFDDGWESRADAERMLALSKLNDEELAQGHSKSPCDAL